jgi:hypothetical protein
VDFDGLVEEDMEFLVADQLVDAVLYEQLALLEIGGSLVDLADDVSKTSFCKLYIQQAIHCSSFRFYFFLRLYSFFRVFFRSAVLIKCLNY